MQIEKEAVKEDVATERAFFDHYYRDHRDRQDPLDSTWVAKATHPSSWPLDYWEYTFYLVGDLHGKRALEIGCGAGLLTRMLALKGASVSAIDVSEEGCISTRMKLEKNGLPFETICVMDAHSLKFLDESFDLVFMAGVLHHVNIQKVLVEVRRVLRAGGRVVCYEPLRYGRIMRFLKDFWLKAKGLRDHDQTEHEEALADAELIAFGQTFSAGFIRKFNFLAKTNRLENRFGLLASTLRWSDYLLLTAAPPLRRFCTCAVCCFEK